MLMLKLRWAPAGGGGKGAARWTRRTASASSEADPDDRAIPTDASAPDPATLNATVAVPLARTEGRRIALPRLNCS